MRVSFCLENYFQLFDKLQLFLSDGSSGEKNQTRVIAIIPDNIISAGVRNSDEVLRRERLYKFTCKINE